MGMLLESTKKEDVVPMESLVFFEIPEAQHIGGIKGELIPAQHKQVKYTHPQHVNHQFGFPIRKFR
jgi:hypothetical protein